MASLPLHLPLLRLYILVSISRLLLLPPTSFAAAAQCKRPPVIFNFGDSNSDTGGSVSGLGFLINPPYGRTFFHGSPTRMSDGRLIIDFLCQSLNTSFLSPYLDSLSESEFTNGANFAVVGSTILPTTLPKFLPFSLNIQVMQFLHFKARILERLNAGSKNLINDEGFQNALYMIDIGQNDIASSFSKNHSYTHVIKLIPSMILGIDNAIKTLYNQGGRKFWIHNTGPLGCLPQILATVQNKDADSIGCISNYNNVAKIFNEALRHLCVRIQSQLTDATIVYVDIYSIKYDLISNSSKYGFSSPLTACCGFGGPPYNINKNEGCGFPGNQVCEQGSKSVSWDGIHYTEATNAFVTSKLLSTAYSSPQITFDFFC